jgi:quercetin dioxygenase-like cupin family protein
MKLIDQRSERPDQQKRKFEACALTRIHVHMLAQKDNPVYYLDNVVVDRRDPVLSKVIRATERRRSATPAGVMTTLASPTQGETAGLSLWEVEMTGGRSGPLHVFDTEQIWTVLEGELSVDIAGEAQTLGTGDTVVIPAELERKVAAKTDVRLIVCGHAGAIARVPGEPEPRGTPAWIG